jgi:hypothetical protein
MFKTLITAATLVLAVTSAHAEKIPEFLTGDWCHVSTDIFIKAKNYCKPTRPQAYIIRPVGFWVKLADVKTKVICVPLSVEPFAHGWGVTADCGAEDNSTAIHRFEFIFEDGEMNGGPKGSIAITKRKPD